VFAQIGIDVGLRHGGARDLALAQPLQCQFVAQVGPEGGDGQTGLGQARAQLADTQVVATGHLRLGGVDGAVFDPDAGLGGRLQQHLFVDQALEHLPPQLGARVRGRVGGRLHPCQPRTHLGQGDGLAVDQGDDVVRRGGHRRAATGGGGLRHRRHGRHQAGGAGQGDQGAAAADAGGAQGVIHSVRSDSAG